jgi:hypothetical protein
VTSLRERFDDAVASPAPTIPLSGETVYATALHRRRVRNRVVSAVVAGGTAAVVAVVALLVTADGRDRAAPTPAVSQATPSPSASAPTNVGQPYSVDGRMEQVVATDADHLYAVQLRCTTADEDSCASVLYGSDDAGKTWTERKRGIASGLQALAPGVLGAFVTTSVSSVAYRISTDGGRTWKDSKPASGTIQAVPAGGWPTCVEEQRDSGRCTVYGVNPQTGAQRKLASQPSTIRLREFNRTPPGTGLWATGYVPQTYQTAIAFSHDNGRTWSTHVFGKDEPDYPNGINNQQVGIATLDGITVYAVVTAVRNDGKNRLLVYRSGDGGLTWQRGDPGHEPPWQQHGEYAYVAADGTLVVQTVIADPAEWYTGTTAFTKPAPTTGLEHVDDMGQPVLLTAPGVYTAFDRTHLYTSPDGLHWTRLSVRPS